MQENKEQQTKPATDLSKPVFKNPFESVKVNPGDLKIHFLYELDIGEKVVQVPVIFPIFQNLLEDTYQTEFRMVFSHLLGLPEGTRESLRYFMVKQLRDVFKATGNLHFESLMNFIKRDTLIGSTDCLSTKSLLELETAKQIDATISDEILAHVLFFIVPAAVRRTRLIHGAPHISSSKPTELLDYYRTLITAETTEEK